MGLLEGNKFKIVIRNLTDEKTNQITQIPNYFDEQRFSQHNKEAGRLIVKKKFKEVIGLILNSEKEYKEMIKKHLTINKNDFVGALMKIPKNTLKMYIHAYQSYLFNETTHHHLIKKYKEYNKIKYSLGEFIFPKAKVKNKKIKIIGFGTTLTNNKIDFIIKEIMKKEDLTTRDFIIKQLTMLSAEGNERNLITKIKNLKITKEEPDELNKRKKKKTISFALDKGSYATLAIKALIK